MKSCRRTGKTAAVAALVVLGAAAWSNGAAAQETGTERTEHPGSVEHPSAQHQTPGRGGG